MTAKHKTSRKNADDKVTIVFENLREMLIQAVAARGLSWREVSRKTALPYKALLAYKNGKGISLLHFLVLYQFLGDLNDFNALNIGSVLPDSMTALLSLYGETK